LIKRPIRLQTDRAAVPATPPRGVNVQVLSSAREARWAVPVIFGPSG
jgi:hypothetical protein